MKKTQLSRITSLAAAAFALALAAPAARAANGAADLDGDGIPNIVDPDIDNDGIPNALDRNVDGGFARSGPFANTYIGDNVDNDSPAEKDIDDDGQRDDSLGEVDIDGDGKNDDTALETDIDDDGRPDDHGDEMDIDGDGKNDDNSSEDDIDGDGFDDDDAVENDIDGDSRDDSADDDTDGDGHGNADASETDTDGDGKMNSDAGEDDDDGDGIRDRDDDDDDNDGATDDNDADHHNEAEEEPVEISLNRESAAPSGSRVRAKIQRFGTGKIEFDVTARDLAAGTYDVVIDGAVRGTIDLVLSSGRTEGKVRFETHHNKSDEIELTLDPSGLPMSIVRNGTVYYSGNAPTPPPPDTSVPVTTPTPGTLVRGPAAPAGAHGKIEIDFSTTATTGLEVEIEDVPAGTYELLMGDTSCGAITVEDTGGGLRGKITFDTNPKTAEGELQLDFLAAGQPVTIRQGAAVYFTGTVPAAPPGVGDSIGGNDDNGGGTPVNTALTAASGLSAEAKAGAGVQFGIAGVVGLEVEVEAIPAGDYTLLVGGTARGTITVADAGNGLRGKIKFELEPTAASEILLDFAPAGQAISIEKDATVFFSGTLPNSAP